MKNKQLFLRFLVLLCTLALVFSGAVTAAPGKSKAPERSNRTFDLQGELSKRAEIHQWLISEQVGLGRSNPLSIKVSEGERLEIDSARGEVPERIGITKTVTRGVSFADVNLKSIKSAALGRETGALQATEDGGYVYTAALNSPEAAGIRVHFTGFRLPEKAGVYLYTEDGQVFGPYTGRGPLGDGEFWSHSLVGDEVFLQLRHVGPPSNADLAGTSFNIAGLAHLRPRFLGGNCTENAECVVNLVCADLDTGAASAIEDSKDAVAHMQWISGPYVNFCSGGLLADEVADDPAIPYFLTANHCISRGKDAKSLETFFKLDDVTRNTVEGFCSGDQALTCSDWRDIRSNHPEGLRTLGATIRATNRTSDYTLLELSQRAPNGTVLLGWNTTPVATVDDVELFRISHPSMAPQSYSKHVVDTSYGTCSSWPRGNWIYSRDIVGATEGGSSGSPVVNAAGQVVGQLSGGCGTDVYNTCNSVENATVDGAFAAYFPDIAHILDPSPVQCTPEPEICDQVDNDCDGAVDEDGVCDQGGGGGNAAGESCQVNSDCASNKCTGKPGAKICK